MTASTPKLGVFCVFLFIHILKYNALYRHILYGGPIFVYILHGNCLLHYMYILNFTIVPICSDMNVIDVAAFGLHLDKQCYLNGEKNLFFPSWPSIMLSYRLRANLPLALANFHTLYDDVTSMTPRRSTAPRRSQWFCMTEPVNRL